MLDIKCARWLRKNVLVWFIRKGVEALLLVEFVSVVWLSAMSQNRTECLSGHGGINAKSVANLLRLSKLAHAKPIAWVLRLSKQKWYSRE